MTRDYQDIKRRRDAEARQRRYFPTLPSLLGALGKSNVLSYYMASRDELLMADSPVLSDLPAIYGDRGAALGLVTAAVRYVYALKENALPMAGTLEVAAGNFMALCETATVDQLLSFAVEFPTVRQYSRGFVYTDMASAWREFRQRWQVERNKAIERAEKLRQRESGTAPSGEPTGRDALRGYVTDLYARGVDVRYMPLYVYGHMSPSMRREIETLTPPPSLADTVREYGQEWVDFVTAKTAEGGGDE